MRPERSFFSLRGDGMFGVEMMRAIEAIIVPAEEDYLSKERALVTLVSHKEKIATPNEKKNKMVGETVVELRHPSGQRDVVMYEMKIVCGPRGFTVELLDGWRDPTLR